MTTYAVYRSRDGLLWISTKYGLNRYDGDAFKHYTKEKNGLHRNDQIVRIEEDEQGKIWLFYAGFLHHDWDKTIISAIDVFDPLN